MPLPRFRSVFPTRENPNTRSGRRAHALFFADPPRNLAVVALGELCGTFMFLLLSFVGAQTALDANAPGADGKSDPSAPLLPFTLLYIAASFGAALAVNVWIFFRVTGGMFNPAVTLGLVLVGAVKPLRAAVAFAAQLVAAIAAAAATSALIPGPLTVGNKLSPGVSVSRGLFLEMFLTAQLVLTVYFLAVEKHRSTYLAPLGIGASVFLAHLCGTRYTGTSINPARSFGPAVVTAGDGAGGFPGYHWIFWLGPLLGALLAWSCYAALKWLEYETVNPGQDAPDLELANRDAAAPTAADVHRTEKFYPKPAPPPPPPLSSSSHVSAPASPRFDVRPDSGISTAEIMEGRR